MTGWGLNQLRLEPLGGDFELVNAQFPPGARTGGFRSTNGFPPTASVFPPRGERSSIFSCRKRRAIYDFGPSLPGEEVDRAMRDRIPEKARQSTYLTYLNTLQKPVNIKVSASLIIHVV